MNHINIKIKALYKQYITIVKYLLIGSIMAVIGVLSAIILDGDITVAIMLIPLGIWLIFTKNKAIYENEGVNDNDI